MSVRRQSLRVVGLALAGAALPAAAQMHLRPYVEPAWATLVVNRASLGVYTEIYGLETTSAGYTSKETRWFVGPLLGLDLFGSIYHPNLLTYRLTMDGSYGQQHDELSGSGGSFSQTERRFLGSFNGEVAFLDSKPFHGRAYANFTHTFQDYDFFNRVYVDMWRYGGNLHYLTGPWTFNASVSRDIQDITGYALPSDSDTRMFSFDATHTRPAGSTTLAGYLSDYDRVDFGTPTSGQNYNFALSDAEDFGDRKQFHSVVNANYDHIESFTTPTELYTVMGNLRADHTEDLIGQYFVTASRYDTDVAQNDNLNGSASLQHQLFDSLTSTLSAQGYQYKSTSGPNEQESWQIGGGPGLSYTKRLSASTTLNAFESFSISHTDVQSNGGIIPVINEAHSFGTGSGGAFSLRQPNVILSSIVVTDTANNPPTGYRQGIDYDVIPNGQLVIIQRRVGSIMPDSVLVDYSFFASPSGAYNTLNNACGVRLDFFNNHWSVYARLNLNQNNGDPYLVVQDLVDLVVGTEVNWRWLRAGVEYQNYNSSLSPYEALRLYQSILLIPEDRSSLSLNFTETFLTYIAADRAEQNYSAILRYSHNLTRKLAANLELGASQRIGPDMDETLAVFRPQLEYVDGKFSATIGYDFGYDEYLNTQERIRNMGFARLRREF